MPQYLYTACTGRCGQSSLAAYINTFGKRCFAEVEPPELVYKSHWPLGNWIGLIQRKWILTHELLGRGKALTWYDEDKDALLDRLAQRRHRRVQRLLKSHDADYYIELSKFFIRSYCDATHRIVPDMGALLLYRNPLKNARSFVNRKKNFSLDGVMPFFKKACFPIDIDRLSKYQLYLWQWVEIDLRYQRFVEENRIERHSRFRTEDLNDIAQVSDLFDQLGIERTGEITPLQPRNTNLSQGRKATAVLPEDHDAFLQFLEMIPSDIMGRIPHILDYQKTQTTVE
ncbi:MAG: hypothetical protein HQL50_05050 [Magnetococcales bacterium]|nr:hypothetical protein [Magnetococcales bacterium]